MTQATLKDTKKFDTKEVYVCLDFVVDNLLKKVLATIIIYRSEYVNLCLRKHIESGTIFLNPRICS